LPETAERPQRDERCHQVDRSTPSASDSKPTEPVIHAAVPLMATVKTAATMEISITNFIRKLRRHGGVLGRRHIALHEGTLPSSRRGRSEPRKG
jgi:hypothetical protein